MHLTVPCFRPGVLVTLSNICIIFEKAGCTVVKAVSEVVHATIGTVDAAVGIACDAAN